MQALALVIHVALAIAVIGLVLIQHGKGAEAGAAFGSGASSTVFGARGSASFLTRVTTGLAAAFFATSLFLFYLAAHRDGGIGSVTDSLPDAILEETETNTGTEESDPELPVAPSSDSTSTSDDGATATDDSELPKANSE